jgi:hypothetical protein
MSNQGAPKEFSKEVKALTPLDDAHWQKEVAVQIYTPNDQDPNFPTRTDSAKEISRRGKTLVKGGQFSADFGTLVIADDQAHVSAEGGSRVRVSNGGADALSGSKVVAGDGATVQAAAGSFVLGEKGSTTFADGDVLVKSGGRVMAQSDSHVVVEAGGQVVACPGSTVYLEDGAAAVVAKGAHISGPGVKNALQLVEPDLLVAPAGSQNVGVPFSEFLRPHQADENAFRESHDVYSTYQRTEAKIATPYQSRELRLIVAKGAQYTAKNDLPVLTIAERGSHVTVSKAADYTQSMADFFGRDLEELSGQELSGQVVAAPGSHVRVDSSAQVLAFAGADVSGDGEKFQLQGTYLGTAADRSILGLKIAAGEPYAIYQLAKGDSKLAPGYYVAPADSKIEAGADTFVEALNGSKVEATNGASILGFEGSETLAHAGSNVEVNPGAMALADAGSEVSVHLQGIAWAHAGAKTDALREWTGEGSALNLFTDFKEYKRGTVIPLEQHVYGELQQLHLAPASKPGTFRELDNLVKEEDWKENIQSKLHEFVEKITFGSN